MDATDLTIIEQLERNARQTLSEIAATVNLSGPAVKRRIDRLESEGVIVGYTIRVDQAKLGRPLSAFTELRFTGSTAIDEIRAIAEEMSEIESFYMTAGDPDALVQLRVENVDHLRQLIDRFRRSGKVTGTKTLMVLEAWNRG